MKPFKVRPKVTPKKSTPYGKKLERAGLPASEKKKMIRCNFFLPLGYLEKMDIIKDHLQTPHAHQVRTALRKYFIEIKNEMDVPL